VILLHDMQKEAIGAFVDYLDRRSRIKVQALETGTPLLDGVCYVHPATVRADLSREGGSLVATLAETGPSSVRDVREGLLMSASSVLGPRLVAVLLSGGNGGTATGLRMVKRAGGVTLIQDPASSTDPRGAEAAIREGVVDYRASADTLAEIFQNLIKLVAKGSTAAPQIGEHA
jgi:chemotaxis response regulator CheB